MNLLGLDLGSTQIKSVEIRREPKVPKPFLANYALAPAPPNSFLNDNEDDFKNYAEELKDFLSTIELNTQQVVASLPESKSFSQVISLPQMPDKELKSAITYEAEQHLPMPLKEVSFSYQVLGNSVDPEGKEVIDVLIVAAPKNLVQRYADLLEKVGLTIAAFETEAIALARVAAGDGSTVTTLAANIGAATTSLAIMARGQVRFTRSISTGGVALTKALSQSLGLEVKQAEEYKKTYGLDDSQLEGRVAEAIKPVFSIITEEIRRSLDFYATHQRGDQVRRLVLSGGSALLRGALTYFPTVLNLETELADPWTLVEVPAKYSSTQLAELGPTLAVAAGLALKEI